MDFGLCWTNNAPSEAGICSGGDLNQSGSPTQRLTPRELNKQMAAIFRSLRPSQGWHSCVYNPEKSYVYQFFRIFGLCE